MSLNSIQGGFSLFLLFGRQSINQSDVTVVTTISNYSCVFSYRDRSIDRSRSRRDRPDSSNKNNSNTNNQRGKTKNASHQNTVCSTVHALAHTERGRRRESSQNDKKGTIQKTNNHLDSPRPNRLSPHQSTFLLLSHDDDVHGGRPESSSPSPWRRCR